MSEFSESYHLRSTSQDDAIQLLRAASRRGFVFPPSNGWVTFVASDGTFEPDPALVAHNSGTLLHYVNAEDHGWSFAVFEQNKRVLAYKCEWNDDLVLDDSHFFEDTFRSYVDQFGAGAADDIVPLLFPDDAEEAVESEAAHHFGEIMGLEHFDWLSFDTVEADFDPDNPEGVTPVG